MPHRLSENVKFYESAGSPDSYLITTFDEKLDALTSISDADKAAYKTANQAAVTGHLIKGYRILTDGLKNLPARTVIRAVFAITGRRKVFPVSFKPFAWLVKVCR